MIFYLILGVLIISLTLNGFLKKSLVQEVNVDEYMFVMCHIIFVSTYLYILIRWLTKKNNIRPNLLKKMNKKTIYLFIFCGINAIIASCLFVYLLKQNDVSYIVPHTSSLLIILTLLIGYYFFQEKINLKKIIGSLLVILGLICINLKDNKSLTQSNI